MQGSKGGGQTFILPTEAAWQQLEADAKTAKVKLDDSRRELLLQYLFTRTRLDDGLLKAGAAYS